MRNVTITLAEDVARWVRVWAAENDTSVSRFVGDLLKGRMEQDRGYGRSQRRFLAQKPAQLKRGGAYPTRDEMHERNLLR